MDNNGTSFYLESVELRDALLSNRDEVATALTQAELELAELHRRSAQLEALIQKARMVLDLEGETTASEATVSRLTLHAAMQSVLRDAPQGMPARRLAEEINRRGLYTTRTGRSVDTAQIHARVNGYGSLFGRSNGRIVLQDRDT